MRAGKLKDKQSEQGIKLLTCRHPAIAMRGYAATIKSNDAAAVGSDVPPHFTKAYQPPLVTRAQFCVHWDRERKGVGRPIITVSPVQKMPRDEETRTDEGPANTK